MISKTQICRFLILPFLVFSTQTVSSNQPYTQEDYEKYLYECKPKIYDDASEYKFISCYLNVLISSKEPRRCWTVINKENRFYCKQYYELRDSARSLVEFRGASVGCHNEPREYHISRIHQLTSCVKFRMNKPYYENAKYFYGSRCSVDCSGHKAGFEWAKSNNIYRKRECFNQSVSFEKGCKIYVKTN